MSSDFITLRVPAKPEYVMIARLTSSAVADRVGFDVDQIEDIKMSVAEAIILIINQPLRPKDLLVKYLVGTDKIHIEIVGEGDWEKYDISTHEIGQGQLSRYILGSMMDKVEFKTDNDIMQAICMQKDVGV